MNILSAEFLKPDVKFFVKWNASARLLQRVRFSVTYGVIAKTFRKRFVNLILLYNS
jgi:hypothetical protein